MKDFINLIKENAKNSPQTIAVIDRDRKITYSEFLALVNSISHHLVSTLKPRIAFDLSQSIESYALIVATLNVGGTFCPLNPEAPIERKRQILSEFAPDFIVVDSKHKELELKPEKAILISELLSNHTKPKISINHSDDDTIYIIYTSGTSGNPKGVKICRKALNKFLEWSIPTYGANEQDVWGQFSLLSFDLSIVDIFTCLCSGSTLYAMNDMNAKKYRPANEIEKQKITIWHSIPSAVEFMIKNEKSKTHDFSSLRLMSFCGETLQKHHVEFLFGKKHDLTIFNTYGPTEGTLFCTWQELKSKTYLEYFHHSMSIGKPIPGWNLQLKKTDEYEGSEIILYGEYIGKGYLGPVNDSKFKAIKVKGDNVESFETGDIVNTENGNLFFSCRKDRQVKIKGYRVELDEIDLRIREFLNLPCVTLVWNEILYSFIETNKNIPVGELRQFLKTKLELYKIPNGFHAIDEIPRNQNHKVNVDSLIKKLP
ncbi:AMP-binding protein [Psychroserpens sp.]